MAVNKQTIKDWTGKIIGFIEIHDNGDKVVKDFYHRILGKYIKKMDVTKDFYGRIVAKGDQSAILFSLPNVKK